MTGRILIVEDDKNLANAEQDILEAAGYEVLYAPHGPAALDLLAQQTVDLVLLDVMMPHMDGYEVCRRLREDQDTSRLKIIMVTARGSTEETVTGLDAGADDYLPKPFEVPELLARVQAQLRLRELQERLVDMAKAATVGQMAITLSHEINNPLTSILGHARLLQETLQSQPSISADVLASLQAIENEAQRIQSVMEQLRRIEKPVVSEYVSGKEMIDLYDPSSRPPEDG
jgi:DNA-binding response OmpR family regulator